MALRKAALRHGHLASERGITSAVCFNLAPQQVVQSWTFVRSMAASWECVAACLGPVGVTARRGTWWWTVGNWIFPSCSKEVTYSWNIAIWSSSGRSRSSRTVLEGRVEGGSVLSSHCESVWRSPVAATKPRWCRLGVRWAVVCLELSSSERRPPLGCSKKENYVKWMEGIILSHLPWCCCLSMEFAPPIPKPWELLSTTKVPASRTGNLQNLMRKICLQSQRTSIGDGQDFEPRNALGGTISWI